MDKHYSLTETAKLIRQTLKVAFPDTVFSVRSKSYSGGSSITVYWTNGPLTKAVDRICKRFEGASFDGSQDLKSRTGAVYFRDAIVTFAPDWVFTSRSISEEVLQIAAYRVHKETKLPLLEVRGGQVVGGNEQVPFTYFPENDVIANGVSQRIHGGEWYQQLVNQVSFATATPHETGTPELPEAIRKELLPTSQDQRATVN